MLPRPPLVSRARPVLGHLMDLTHRPLPLLERGFREHGDIFSLRLPGRPCVVLAGPKHNRFFFGCEEDTLSIRSAYPFFKHMFAPDFFLMADTENYRQQRDLVLPRFRGRQLDAYVDVIDRHTTRFIAGLGRRGTLDLETDLGSMLMRVASDAFLGDDFGRHFQVDVAETFHQFSRGIHSFIPGWAPVPRMIASRQARDQLRQAISTQIKNRWQTPKVPPDFMQALSEARFPDGTAVPLPILVNLVIMLIWSGHGPTVGHLSWAILELLRHPAELEQILAEQETTIDSDGPLTVENLRACTRLDAALRETERLHPVAQFPTRIAVRTVEYAGFQLPEKSVVLVSPHLSHRTPELFPEPQLFRPQRFVDQPRLSRYLIGFGAGAHRCLGMAFAYLEMKVVMIRLLQKLSLHMRDPMPPAVYSPHGLCPQSPCRIYFERRAGVS